MKSLHLKIRLYKAIAIRLMFFISQVGKLADGVTNRWLSYVYYIPVEFGTRKTEITFYRNAQ